MLEQEVYYKWRLPPNSKLYWGGSYFSLFETIIPYKTISVDEDMGGIELKNGILIDCGGCGQTDHFPKNTHDIAYYIQVIPHDTGYGWRNPIEKIECYDALSVCVTMEKLAWKYH